MNMYLYTFAVRTPKCSLLVKVNKLHDMVTIFQDSQLAYKTPQQIIEHDQWRGFYGAQGLQRLEARNAQNMWQEDGALPLTSLARLWSTYS